MIRRLTVVVAGLLAVGAGAHTGWAQTHKVAKPETVVRAVGVYEWTGEIAKPTASRLIPVTMFIDGTLEDAGAYLARPVPFALQTGNLYELQQAGLTKGSLELSYARHLQAVDTATGATAYDDGWFGYGMFKAPTVMTVKKTTALKASAKVPEITTSGKSTAAKSAADDGRPHFSNKGGDDKAAADKGSSDTGAASSDSKAADKSADKDSDSSGAGRVSTSDGKISDPDAAGGSTPAGDPERPTMRRRGTDESASSGSGSGGSGNSKGKGKDAGAATVTDSAPVDDPDRPHLSKKPESSGDGTVAGDVDGGAGAGQSGSGRGGAGDSSAGDSGASGSKGTSTGSGGSADGRAPDDTDRPTLKRRSPEEAKRQQQASGRSDRSTVSGVGSLNDDPDRPTIHRGKPASSMNEDDLPKLKGLPVDMKQMVAVSDAVNREPHNFTRAWEDDAERAAILTKMQALARAKLAAYEAGAASSAATAAKTGAAAAKRPAVATTGAARRKAAAAAAAAPAPVALLDEDLKGYTLSYGGAPTYVYMAHTAGAANVPVEYVTEVAQADALGEVKPAIESVTDAGHLDRTPRLRLVDVVDVEASNRASLLFELREAKSRQFALYRVIGARADQTFVTGTTQ